MSIIVTRPASSRQGFPSLPPDELSISPHDQIGQGVPSPAQPAGLMQEVEPAKMDRIENAILVTVQSQHDEISVEQTAFYVFEVVNIGIIVEHFLVAVHGLPETWAQLSTPRVQLMKGERGTLQLSITPPRAPTSAAGLHSFDVIFTSPNYPGQEYKVTKELTIRPYSRFTVSNFVPQKLNIPWRKHVGKTMLPISNQGNSPMDFNVSAVDEENGCSFDFRLDEHTRLYRQAVVSIPAGETFNLPVEVTPRHQPLVSLTSNRYLFTTTVQVLEPSVMPQTVSGTAVYRPLLGRLSILLVILVTMAGLIYGLQPRIYSFQAATGKDVIGLGDATRLEWESSPFATLLDISNVDQQIKRGQTSLMVSPAQSTTYELTARNWLSDLLGLSYKFIQTILVIPPQPNINVFEVDQTSVAKGKPSLLRWSVTQSDQVLLTIDDVVYELSKEEFSGERQVILEKDALVTLEARNASGSELRSYFINVVPPSIVVRTFVVWARPQALSGYQPGTPKLAAWQYAPDPNFPEKLVELVQDSSSDSGYRVEFLQPDRELQKGEQIILEWDVIGTDNGKIQVAPFTEALPARGNQPFFPQESMNFVLTARSGELEQLFMLPVKVFDGEPPKPPTIEFFKASPVKMVGPGDVQFAWSVSGEWTRVQIASGEEVIADYLNPQGFRTVHVSKSATFILTAWNGELTSAAPVEVTVEPSLIPVKLAIKAVYPITGRFLIGDKLAVTVAFSEVPADKPDPTGKIIVTDGFSNCTITLPAVTCDLTFNTPGLKTITASYEGDKIYLQADSDPLSGVITVASSTVTLNPTYYYLNSAGNGPGAIIGSLINTQLNLDDGLYVKVNVQPVNTVLRDDQKGRVTLSVCEQELQNGQPAAKIETCMFIGTATVIQSKVDDEFYADIVLKNFPSAGTQVLLFEYRHDDNAITPTSLSQTDVVIGKIGIYLSLPLCATDADTFVGCTLGVTNASNAKITFDIKKGDDHSLLSSVLPMPSSSAFQVFDYSVSPQKNWSCGVVNKDSTYKLECTANFTGLKNVTWSYRLDSAKDVNYILAPGKNGTNTSWPLLVVESTSLVLSIPSNVKVGEGIRLTGPVGTARYVEIRDSLGNSINPAGGLVVMDNDPGNAGTYEITSGSNCTMDSVTGDINIPSITAPCEIFFKVRDTYPFTVRYLGDNNNYAPSSSTTQVIANKQTGFAATWKYQDAGTYKDWGTLNSWPINTALPIRIAFNNSSKFIAESLVGMKLTVTLKNGQTPITSADCTSPAVTDGVHEITIVRVSGSGEIVADFNLLCIKQPMRLLFELAFVDTSNFDFMAPESRQLLITQTNTGGYWLGFDMVVEMNRDPGMQSIVQTGPPATLETFYVGETYNLTVNVETIFDYFDTEFYPAGPQSLQELYDRYKNLSVKVALPDYLATRIDLAKSTCPISSDPNYDVEIPLQNTNSTGFEYSFVYYFTYIRYGFAYIRLQNDTPCQLVFIPGSENTATNAVTFDFATQSHVMGNYAISKVFGTSGLKRQTVTITPVAFTGFSGTQQTIVFDLNKAISTNPLTPLDPGSSFDSQFALSLPASCAVSRNPSVDQINTTTQAQFGLTLPGAACSGNITITYNGNNYFNSLTQNVSLNVLKHTSEIESIMVRNGGGTLVDFAPAATDVITGTLQMQIQVADADIPAHALIPTGSVEIWLTDSAGALEGGGTPPVYAITQVTGGGAVSYNATTRRYTVALNASGQALFAITFQTTGPNTDVTLRYLYTGDGSFNGTPEQTRQFKINR